MLSRRLVAALVLAIALWAPAHAAQVSNPASPTQSTSVAAAVLPNYISGCALSNNGLQGLDVAACNARDGGDAVSMSTTVATTAKALQTAWAVGSSAGCLDTGAIAASTSYAVWAIQRTDTSVTDFLCSLSFSAPALPTNYTKSRYIGGVRTDGSSNIISFTQDGDDFWWSTPSADIAAANPGTAAVTRTLTVPVGVRVKVYVFTGFSNSTVSTPTVYLSDLSNTDVAAALTGAVTFAVFDNERGGARAAVWTNTSAQIRSRLTNSASDLTLYITTLGWMDPRGKK